MIAATVAALIGLVLGFVAGAIAVVIPTYRQHEAALAAVASWRRRARALAHVARMNGVSAETVNALLADEDQADDPDATQVLGGRR